MDTLQSLSAQLKEHIVSYNAGNMTDLQFILVYEPLMRELFAITKSYIDEGDTFINKVGPDYWTALGVDLTYKQVSAMLTGSLMDHAVSPISGVSSTQHSTASSQKPSLSGTAKAFSSQMWSNPSNPTFNASWIDAWEARLPQSPSWVDAWEASLPQASQVGNSWERIVPESNGDWHVTSIATPELSTVDTQGTYTFRWGDTLGALANRIGVSIEAIAKFNGITDPNKIYCGQVIKIPGKGPYAAYSSSDGSSSSGGSGGGSSGSSGGGATTASVATPAPSPAFVMPVVSSAWSGAAIGATDISYNEGAVERFGSGKKLYTDKSQNTFLLPGYTPAKLQVLLPMDSYYYPQGDKLSFEFIIGPQGMTETHNSDIQQVKTGGGWMLYRTGPGLTQLSLSGYFLDTAHIDERRRFMELYYKQYLIDKRKAFGDYFNNNRLSIEVEGMRYEGVLTNLSLSKSTQQMFTFSYQMSFICVSQKTVQTMLGPDNISVGGQVIKNPERSPLDVGQRILPVGGTSYKVLKSSSPKALLSSLSSTPYDINKILGMLKL